MKRPTVEVVPPPPANLSRPGKVKGRYRDNDKQLTWVIRDYPQLEAWRDLARQWIAGEPTGLKPRLQMLGYFLEKYVMKQGLPIPPEKFLLRTTRLPDFYGTVCPKSRSGVKYNNHLRDFLDFVLREKFSEPDDSGRPVVASVFCNPVEYRSSTGERRLDESVHSPLPYDYITELREILAAGPHFKDWSWAQTSMGTKTGGGGRLAPDWFPVSEDQINPADPDCVWRMRQKRGGPCWEMWSPVRWVALLVKLHIFLRTFQVRMLDSGESDTWRYESGTWRLNSHRLTEGHQGQPWQNGIFRRLADPGAAEPMTVLYINTNKTQDMAKSGSDKGYVIHWEHQDLLYWLEKLRNWQETYNSIKRRTAWTELDGRQLADTKSDVQLGEYPDTCFLFRLREVPDESERRLPVTNGVVERAWSHLLVELQQRCAVRGETHRNGMPIQFVPSAGARTPGIKTLFPLHSLRVSLITALALEGQVPFPILARLTGHSRMLMTIYYVKPGATHLNEVLAQATARLGAEAEASIQRFLCDTEYSVLVQQAICNSEGSLRTAISEAPAARNPAGWMGMSIGLCLVGGNTAPTEGNSRIGGCHNGGAVVDASNGIFGPVPGGVRNCVRCRWFITEPHYIPALGAHFNVIGYHIDEARTVCLQNEQALQGLKAEKAAAEATGILFTRIDECKQRERLWESALARFDGLVNDQVATYRLIKRCQDLLKENPATGMQLVGTGSLMDLRLAFEETESELLQLVGVCRDVEIYPDEDPGKAIFRRSQLLDSALYRDQLPPIFMTFDEHDQLLLGNRFVERLAQAAQPGNPELGNREVVALIDAGRRLGEVLGIDWAEMLRTVLSHPPVRLKDVTTPIRQLKETP